MIKAGTKIVLSLETGYCGSDCKEGHILSIDWSEDELDEFTWERAIENAESYGIYYLPHYEDELTEEELEDDSNCYTDNICGSWEIYDPEEHNAYLVSDEFSEI